MPQPCSQHVSPIEWDNVILYGQYVLGRAGPLRNGSLCCISTRMWALPLFGLDARCFQGADGLEGVEGGMHGLVSFPMLLREAGVLPIAMKGEALYPIPRMMVNSLAVIAMKAPGCNHRARYRSDLTAKISALVAS